MLHEEIIATTQGRNQSPTTLSDLSAHDSRPPTRPYRFLCRYEKKTVRRQSRAENNECKAKGVMV